MSTGPSAPPPPPGGGFRWGWGWHDPAAHGVHPHHHHAYYRYGWYPRGPGRHRLFWFAVGAGTTYWLTHARNCEHNKDFRGWRAQREAERASQVGPASTAGAWGPWGGGEWPSSSSANKTRSEAADTALELSEAMLNSISQTVDVLRRRLAEKRAQSADPSSETQPPKPKLI